MALLTLTLVTGAVFLIADAVMLSTLMRPLFARHLGAVLLDGVRPRAALLFYLLYLFGIVWFAGLPGLRAGPRAALLNGAILGLVAYGTFELTAWAVLRDWHWRMVLADIAWGTVLTAAAAWAGAAAAARLA